MTSDNDKKPSMIFQAKILTATSPGGLFLMNAINLPVFKPDETKFFGDIIKATLDHRRKTKER